MIKYLQYSGLAGAIMLVATVGHTGELPCPTKEEARGVSLYSYVYSAGRTLGLCEGRFHAFGGIPALEAKMKKAITNFPSRHAGYFQEADDSLKSYRARSGLSVEEFDAKLEVQVLKQYAWLQAKAAKDPYSRESCDKAVAALDDPKAMAETMIIAAAVDVALAEFCKPEAKAN